MSMDIEDIGILPGLQLYYKIHNNLFYTGNEKLLESLDSTVYYSSIG